MLPPGPPCFGGCETDSSVPQVGMPLRVPVAMSAMCHPPGGEQYAGVSNSAASLHGGSLQGACWRRNACKPAAAVTGDSDSWCKLEVWLAHQVVRVVTQHSGTKAAINSVVAKSGSNPLSPWFSISGTSMP